MAEQLTTIDQIKAMLCNHCEHICDTGHMFNDPELVVNCPAGDLSGGNDSYQADMVVMVDDDNVYCEQARECEEHNNL